MVLPLLIAYNEVRKPIRIMLRDNSDQKQCCMNFLGQSGVVRRCLLSPAEATFFHGKGNQQICSFIRENLSHPGCRQKKKHLRANVASGHEWL